MAYSISSSYVSHCTKEILYLYVNSKISDFSFDNKNASFHFNLFFIISINSKIILCYIITIILPYKYVTVITILNTPSVQSHLCRIYELSDTSNYRFYSVMSAFISALG